MFFVPWRCENAGRNVLCARLCARVCVFSRCYTLFVLLRLHCFSLHAHRRTGRPYYKNRVTKKTQWERPADYVEPTAPATSSASTPGGAARGRVGDVRVESVVNVTAPVPGGYRSVMLPIPHPSVAGIGQSFRHQTRDGVWYVAVVPPGARGGTMVKGLVPL